MSELAYKRTNVYEKADEKLLKEIFDYAEGYKTFLDEGKTEREVCAYVVDAAKKAGYKPFEFGMKLKAGDKIYYNNRGKNVYLIRMGKADVAKDGTPRVFEAHRDYLDIHYVISGSECVGYSDIDKLTVEREYDAEGDYLLLRGEVNRLILSPGEFCIVFPEDAHIPGMIGNTPSFIKAVVKIKL